MWVWYSLVSAIATRDDIDDFMFVKNPVDFTSGPWAEGTKRFQSWIERGYVGKDIAGLNFEQATVNFLSGKAAMVVWTTASSTGQLVKRTSIGATQPSPERTS